MNAGTPQDLRRDSPMVELSLLLAECMQHGLRTIAFCKVGQHAPKQAYGRESKERASTHTQDSFDKPCQIAECQGFKRDSHAPAIRRPAS